MIYINGSLPPEQPSSCNENPTQVKTDTYAIDGTPSRLQLPSKNRAKISYPACSPATFQFFKALYDSATTVVYRNTDSNVAGGILEFTAIIDLDENDYIRGGSKLVPLEITFTGV